MKNIHILPTDKPTRLFTFESELTLSWYSKNTFKTGKNIYITSDEDINENDYIITKDGRLVQVSYLLSKDLEGASKVILTTDQDLIADGVQAIDDDFLEWFVKNPSCESIGVERDSREVGGHNGGVQIEYGYYEIIIPSEEPKNICIQTGLPCGMQCLSEDTCNRTKSKQETLEEAAERLCPNSSWRLGFINGAKWQAERTIEEVFDWLTTNNYLTDLKETLIESFKNRLQG